MRDRKNDHANPWLEIPLEDYEAHMSLPSVAQSGYFADVIEERTAALRPDSVAVVGCAGGNGFDRISPAVVRRVVGIDINSRYIAETRTRFQNRFDHPEFFERDFTDEGFSIEPVDLVFAHLVFEYVDFSRGLASIKRFLNPEGRVSAILQLPCAKMSPVSPSPFVSLKKLDGIMQLVHPDEFERSATARGFKVREKSRKMLPSGKEFLELLLQVAGK